MWQIRQFFTQEIMMAALYVIGIALAVTGVAWLVRSLIAHRLAKFAVKTELALDDIILVIIRKVNLAVVFVLALYVTHTATPLAEFIGRPAKVIVTAAIFLQIAIWANAIITFLFARKSEDPEEERTNLAARRAMSFVSRLIVWTLVLALFAENIGIELSPLLAGLGIGGIALALAVQNILGDILCYFAIILDKPYVIGDFLIIDDMLGSVEHIGIKTTRIRSLHGEQLIFSNHDLTNSRVRNYKRMAERRIVFQIGVVYQTTVEQLKRIPELVRKTIESREGLRFDRAHFKSFGDFSLNFEIVYYVLSAEYNVYMDHQQAINLELMRLFEAEGIEFAYPTNLTYLRAESVTPNLSVAQDSMS